MNDSVAVTRTDPFAVLGLSQSATEAEIRQRYLDLVKLHPPEKDPQKFRKIHSAYESAKDPLILADQLLRPPPQLPEWKDVIEQQKKNPPRLSASLLLALGNKPPGEDS